MKKTVYARIYGIVQGVGLRYSVLMKAKELGLKGYVKNMPDFSVELEVEGDGDKIDTLLNFIKNGVRWAKVERIDTKIQDYQNKYEDFNIVH
ncbi:acylphosphatase [Thermovenabulum gondwanense]|uniref:acylphosphatase n=1 Tax=Thermovenabulum gondwanense TaxID=520767 RepID=A0A161PVU6_9FIRM|nr:acylphosphatase [Thermovenabulum gondwanense]KYO64812.1 Acylphosphatase [Thermovenabulum gondwanense]